MLKCLIKWYLKLVHGESRFKYSDSDVYKLSMDEFEKLLLSYDYKSDPIFGLIDYNTKPEEFFNRDLKFGRDCDDFARQWSLWGLNNGYDVSEWMIYQKGRLFGTAHIITILYDRVDAKYTLCSYRHYDPKEKLVDCFNDYFDRYRLIRHNKICYLNIKCKNK